MRNYKKIFDGQFQNQENKERENEINILKCKLIM